MKEIINGYYRQDLLLIIAEHSPYPYSVIESLFNRLDSIDKTIKVIDISSMNGGVHPLCIVDLALSMREGNVMNCNDINDIVHKICGVLNNET